MTTNNPIIYEVVSALAEADDVSPDELNYHISDYIDPYMLKTLVSEDMSCELTFQASDHEVTVTDAGAVFIDGVEYRSGNGPHFFGQNQADLPRQPGQIQFQRLINTLPCVVYKTRNQPDRPVDFVSEGCYEVMGYDANTVIGGGVSYGVDIIHPDDRDVVWDTLQEALQNEEQFLLSYRIRTAENKEKRVVETGIGLFNEENPLPVVGVIIDITEVDIHPDISQRILE